MPQNLFAGLDVSTQSTKLVVLDVDQRRILFVDSVNYDTDLPQYKTKDGVDQNQPEGVSESDPLMWIDAVHAVFRKTQSAGIPLNVVRCISVSGQQHGLVSLDAQGGLTRAKSKLWNDFSTAEECAILTERVGGLDAMIAETGNSQRTGYTAAKIFHMARNEPGAFKKTTTFFLVHNFVNWHLTGGKKGGVRVMEPGDTSGMALWNPKTAKWSTRVIEAIHSGLSANLPPVKPSDQTIGTISKDLAGQFGFPLDCKIDAGSGDNMYGAVGTGNVAPGIVTVSLGTSGTAYTFLKEPFVDPTGEIAAFCDSTGSYLPLLCVSNLANGYNDLLRLHGLSHDDFNRIVRGTLPGNGGKILIPWYMGERTPDVPFASPLYFGFGLSDFTKEILCRAVLEGHVLNLADGFLKMPMIPREIRLTGGLSQSEAWCQTIADVFEADTVPVMGEGAALGAALHAAWVWMKENGLPSTIEEVVKPFVVLDEKRRKKPVPKHVEAHRVQKQLFHSLSDRIRNGRTEDPFALRQKLAT
jgi:xylulokinase